MPEKLYISWDEFHRHTRELAQKLKANNYSKIVAVSRGGLLPAGILAYELNIRNVEVINMSSYDGETQRQDKDITVKADIGTVDEQTLIVDDISDTGKTFNLLRPRFPRAAFVSVYAKRQGNRRGGCLCQGYSRRLAGFPLGLNKLSFTLCLRMFA